MVTRKPVPHVDTAEVSLPSNKNANPPYPTTPTRDEPKTAATTSSVYSPDLSTSPAFDLIEMHDAQQRGRSDSDASSHGTWDSDDDEEEKTLAQEAEVPKPLSIRAGQNTGTKPEPLPAILRPGPKEGTTNVGTFGAQKYEEESASNPWAELAKSEQPQKTNVQPPSNNPYMVRHNSDVDSSQSEWQATIAHRPPPIPLAAPPPPPPSSIPAAPVSSTNQSSAEPINATSDIQRPASWETAERFSVPQIASAAENHEPGQPSQQRPTSTWWEPNMSQPQEISQGSVLLNSNPSIEQWSEGGVESEYKPPPGPPPNKTGILIDHSDYTSSPATNRPTPISTSQHTATSSTDAIPETPQTRIRRQRSEHYQIKHINWYDQSDSSLSGTHPGMRRSPILTQNANGPCPLLALVNALILSTPPNLDTALISTLRSREQVSLGLLLDAVFDELTSGRRGNTAQELPDVSELYSFLLALHTGMNVNPRFVSPEGEYNNNDEVQVSHRGQGKVGTFEETREMRLYSTFRIPLIHGWTPTVNTTAYDAFVRSAQTFEDAQNIQFAELELNDKLSNGGLTPEEQQTLQDVQSIKGFLQSWPTQLTDYGLEAISKSLQSGQIVILFRNDHFSTIYKEPRHGALMTLVTDAGYDSHDEIVWESLVDVNGSASELFSGDFRVVSHDQDARLNQGNSGGGEDGWQTVSSRNRYRQNRPPSGELPPPLPGPRPAMDQNVSAGGGAGSLDVPTLSEIHRTASEQEDHDLALALQLQEEEEDRHRQDEERRRREQELSEQFLSDEAGSPRPPTPPPRRPRNNSSRQTSSSVRLTPAGGRPAVNRPTDQSSADAPPSYEQAASDRPYRPGGATPPSGQGNPLGAYDALRRQQSAYAQQSSSNIDSMGGATLPEYVAPNSRRRADTNRVRRRTSQYGAAAVPPGAYPAQPMDGQGAMRVDQAASIRDTEGRCVCM